MKDLIIRSVVTLDYDLVLKYVQLALEEGHETTEIIEYIKIGMNNVGKLFETGEYSVADLMMAGIIFREVLEIPDFHVLENDLTHYKYSILLGTVYDDLHDIGKDIFGSMAKAAGFKIIDLGIDVKPILFSQEIMRIKPNIVALSGVLNSSIYSMIEIVKHLEESGLRNDIKIIVGGSALTQESNEIIGADAFTNDAASGVEICKKWSMEFSEKNG